MQIAFTQKLFYGKHCYKIVIQLTVPQARYWQIPSEATNMVTWCYENLPSGQFVVNKRRGPWDMDNQLATWQICVYFSDPAIKNQILNTHGTLVHELTQPLNEDHKNNLTVKNIVQVRKNLLFKKYKHVIHFKYDRSGDMYKWLFENYAHHNTVMISGNPRWCKVYLQDDADNLYIQMCWEEKIQFVKTVVCLTPQ